jgi:hypothetical protein
MKSNALKKQAPRRQDVYTLEGWAIGLLLEHHAIAECEFHGHRKDRGDPHVVARAREHAWSCPFPGATPEQAVAAINEVLESIGDTCPDCR